MRDGAADRAALVRAGLRLGARPHGRKPFASLFLMTDPVRTPDPLAVAAGLPRGAVVIYRAFGAPGALEEALRLRALTRERGLLLLIGADEALAVAAGADGLHLPERMVARARAVRARRAGWRITTAAHSRPALLRAEKAGVDAVIVSSVFPSRSPSAGEPLGVVRLASMLRGVRTPVIALGGVDARTARRLVGTGAAGLAAIDGWKP